MFYFILFKKRQDRLNFLWVWNKTIFKLISFNFFVFEIWAPFLYGWIPVDRKKLAPSTIKRALGVLKKNEILGIFPDGGVNDTILGNPKNGTVYLSTVGKAPTFWWFYND